jgi:hypothetical protein
MDKRLSEVFPQGVATMSDDELVEIAAEIRHETERAYLLFDGTRTAWVPKSLVEDNGDGTFTMPLFLAEQKEFV